MRPLRNYITATIIEKPKDSPIILLSDQDENPHLMAKINRVGPDVKEAKPDDIIEVRERSVDYRDGDTIIIQEADVAYIREV